MTRCALCLCALSSLLASCSDPSAYDGDWRATMRDTAAVQHVQGMRFDCAHFAEPFFMRVRNGVVSGYLEMDENFSFSATLDRLGRFSARMPTDSVYTYTGSDVSRESAIVLLLEGELAESQRSGAFVIGDEALQDRGCITNVKFEAL